MRRRVASFFSAARRRGVGSIVAAARRRLTRRNVGLVLAAVRRRLTRRRVVAALLAVVAAPFVIVAIVAVFTPLPAELREPAPPSLRVLAKDGKLLREVRADDGARARPLPLAAFPKRVTDAVLAAEDRHFRSHLGVDVAAVVRAIGSNVAHRRVVSGASTITMQLARTVRPHKRSLWGKITEAGLAVRIEASLSKDEILEQYLNRVVYGPSMRGFAAAAHGYCGVAPDGLSLAEAALVAGLPRGPSLYAVTKRPELARRRRDRVLDRMADAGFVTNEEAERAKAEPIAAALDKPAFGAPHLVRGLASGALASWQPGLAEALGERKTIQEIHTTIDPELQRVAEDAVVTSLAALADRHVTAASVVAIDNATGDVLAWVGSPAFYDEAALGQNDGVVALRQPGSALKPFVYAEAMRRLGFTPATMLPDVEIHIPLPGGGDYVPHDYDQKQRGPVRLREALGSSLNIPAVDTIRRVGTENVLARLHAFGFESLREEAEHYGPALALGDGEVTLVELARAYVALARGGTTKPLRVVKRVVRSPSDAVLLAPREGERVVDERVAAMLADVLADKTARMSAFGDQNVLEVPGVEVAAKTGTSKGFRDNVAVGFSRRVTVAVWAGNFDGSPMQGVSGISGAGPIFRAVMTAASTGEKRRPFIAPESAEQLGLARTSVCALTGDVPGPHCPHTVREWLPADAAEHGATCTVHQAVRVDVRNGLPAGEACGGELVQTRLFEAWPPSYRAWAERMNRPLLPRESSPACPLAPRDDDDGAAPTITYPVDGARFVIDPDRPRDLQLLHVEAIGDDVEVDGEKLPPTREWRLEPGDHVLTARRGATTSKPVRFTVR
ncbi:MAG: penicillin-binding protein 1C [Labilithrix sp.]|nr:penicillin-binding protein 1C [Labilithrix sp.]MCW5815007.1 penicillin-binding protein 1C [Labilithrix sp.]